MFGGTQAVNCFNPSKDDHGHGFLADLRALCDEFQSLQG